MTVTKKTVSKIQTAAYNEFINSLSKDELDHLFECGQQTACFYLIKGQLWNGEFAKRIEKFTHEAQINDNTLKDMGFKADATVKLYFTVSRNTKQLIFSQGV